MSNNLKLIIIAGASVLILVIVLIVTNNSKKIKIKNKVDALFIRFNQVKSLPLAFKFSKAQVKAKRSQDEQEIYDENYQKYEQFEQDIVKVQEVLDNLDDLLNIRDFKSVKANFENAEKVLKDIEVKAEAIETYLDSYGKKDDAQREVSNELKQEYLMVKNTINQNAELLSFGYEGLCKRLNKCEELFSSSEEWLFSSDYENAKKDLETIDKELKEIKLDANEMGKCVKEVKGVIPVLLDEVNREYALTNQRGVYTKHLQVEEKIENIRKNLENDSSLINEGLTKGIKESVSEAKEILNNLLENLADENKAYKQVKDALDSAYEHTNNLIKVENYVRIAYDKDSSHFALEDLKPMLKLQRDNIAKYQNEYKLLCEEMAMANVPSSLLMDKVNDLCARIEVDNKSLYSYKNIIDKSNDSESRAISQLLKLQLVVSEVENKIKQYRISKINDSYNEDLLKSRNYIKELKVLINEVPLNIDELNAKLDEAIDFVYKFYNNVNNIVGMAIMVEKAIVFGNRYRSTYQEIDRELSKAEFQYLNGEYTKALKTAISCMETLFPDNVDERILENSK